MTAVDPVSAPVSPIGCGDYLRSQLDIILKVPLLIPLWFAGVAAGQVGHQADLLVLRIIIRGPVLFLRVCIFVRLY